MPETFGDILEERPQAERRPVLARALAVIDARLDVGLSVAELAGHCGLSASRFNHAFKLTTGVTPHRWLTIRRVDKAKALLRQSATLSLAQIGLACGFADQSHFTHVFTAVVGAAPGEWRRQWAAPSERPRDASRLTP